MISIEVQSWPNEMGFWAERALVLNAEIDGRTIRSVQGESVRVGEIAAWLGQVLAGLGHPVKGVGLDDDLEQEIIAEITAIPEYQPGAADWRQPLILEIETEHGDCETCGTHTDHTLWLKGAIEGSIMSWFESGHMQAGKVRHAYGAYLWMALTQLGYDVSLKHVRLEQAAEAAIF